MSVKAICAITFTLAIIVAFFSSSSPTPPSELNLTADHHHPEPESIKYSQEKSAAVDSQNINKRVNRFLAGEGPAYYRAASHCHKDGEVCLAGEYEASGRTTCCKNKCVNLSYDNKNCGECGKKCKYTQTCCGGKCVYLTYDKSHCGACHHKCGRGNPCLYGMCDYA